MIYLIKTHHSVTGWEWSLRASAWHPRTSRMQFLTSPSPPTVASLACSLITLLFCTVMCLFALIPTIRITLFLLLSGNHLSSHWKFSSRITSSIKTFFKIAQFSFSVVYKVSIVTPSCQLSFLEGELPEGTDKMLPSPPYCPISFLIHRLVRKNEKTEDRVAKQLKLVCQSLGKKVASHIISCEIFWILCF